MSRAPSGLPSAERLRQLLDYDPISGAVKWRVARGNLAAGSCAGGVGPDGYARIKIDRATYLTHRIVWRLVTGDQPENYIDHIDRNRSNNSWANLRPATKSENHQNIRAYKNNTSGYLGVSRLTTNKRAFLASIWLNKKQYRLGFFDDPEEAYAAYCAAKAKLHTFHPTVNL